MTTEFEPDSWLKAAQALMDEAEAFRDGAYATMHAYPDVTTPGARGGATLADQAISEVLTQVFEAVETAVAELTDGIQGDADMMRRTGATYRETEANNVATAAMTDV